MSFNILIIGGSYFIGRIFAQYISKNPDYSVHILNRGNNPIRIAGAIQYKCDRNDLALLDTVPPLIFDAVIDFCAYFPKDVEKLIRNLPGTICQYIHISSCTVYRSSFDYPKQEDSPNLSTLIPGPVGEYAYNKYMLELETKNVCTQFNIPYTIFRPAFVYGPYNYAPRESYFFKLILSNQTIPLPQNNLALFQFIYVSDIAGIIENCLRNPKVYNNEYNLSAPELISYDKLIEVLAEISGLHLKTERFSIDTINRQNITLPFPLEQHEIYSGAKIAGVLNFQYTPFETGMKETFDFYVKSHR